MKWTQKLCLQVFNDQGKCQPYEYTFGVQSFCTSFKAHPEQNILISDRIINKRKKCWRKKRTEVKTVLSLRDTVLDVNVQKEQWDLTEICKITPKHCILWWWQPETVPAQKLRGKRFPMVRSTFSRLVTYTGLHYSLSKFKYQKYMFFSLANTST